MAANPEPRATRYTVVVTDDRFGGRYAEEQDILAEVGARLVVLNLSSDTEAIQALRDADGILLNLFPLGARVIRGLRRCRVISRYGAGYDNVDVPAATGRGIWVARVPDYATEDVGDHALALLMACARAVVTRDTGVRAGEWNLHGRRRVGRIAGKTLGIVGYGRTGSCLHRKTAGLGLGRVLVCDPHVERLQASRLGVEAADLATVLVESDFVSLHVPLTALTRGLIGARELALMKRTAYLINTSRGAVVDEEALAASLVSGRLGGAGLDVFEHEPLPLSSPLRGLDTVVLSDHAAWYSEESVAELKTKAARNVAAVLAGRAPAYPLNIPAGHEVSGSDGEAAGSLALGSGSPHDER